MDSAMEGTILCIDSGLTATKASLFTLTGVEAASHAVATAVECRDDRSEIDMERQWQGVAQAVREALGRARDAGPILAVGVSGHGGGLYCVDGGGRPVRRAITSMDSRARDILEQWSREGRSGRDRLYQELWSGQAIPLLAWLRRHEPRVYDSIGHILMAKDWINLKLTGRAGIEYTDASNGGLMDLRARVPDTGLFERFGVPEAADRLPPLHRSADIVGAVTREAAAATLIPEGTPVIGGLFDCVASAIGSGVCGGEAYSVTAGTWNINAVVSRELRLGPPTLKCSLFADGVRYFPVESSATSAVNLQWFMDRVFREDGAGSDVERYRRVNEGVERIAAASSRLIYLPFLYASNLSADTGGAFFGLRPDHTAMHMVRAIYEGVAFAHRMHIDRLRDAGYARDRAALSGGASNSPVWCRIMADVLGMTVESVGTSGAAALGTAACAAVALGVYGDLPSASAAMTRPRACYHPSPELAGFYGEQYRAFTELAGGARQQMKGRHTHGSGA